MQSDLPQIMMATSVASSGAMTVSIPSDNDGNKCDFKWSNDSLHDASANESRPSLTSYTKVIYIYIYIYMFVKLLQHHLMSTQNL